MNIRDSILTNEEKIIFTLRALYDANGYSHYKMSKFEPYDLYVRNKDFLISDSVITFTDINGKLMALKPDVTLSIIKNTKDVPGQVQKVYYNETVYRVAGAGRNYREMMQVGLECIGDVDDACTAQVLDLACRSLRAISSECVLDIAHPGVLYAVLDEMPLSEAQKKLVCKYVAEKNRHELAALCQENGLDAQVLDGLIRYSGKPEQVIPQLKALPMPSLAVEALDELQEQIQNCQNADMLRLDFSVVGNAKYYNGITFKGFVSGVPESVLSGGRYDLLLRRMGRTSGAIGFAVYLDALERLAIGEVSQ